MCHSKEIAFQLKTSFAGRGVLNGPKMDSNDPPPPSPIQASAKVSCQGANKLEKLTFLMIFYYFYKK